MTFGPQRISLFNSFPMNTVTQEQPPKTQRDTLLDVARSLDQFGRRFERFAALQLEQLQIAIDQFERDKAEFERQRDREIQQIENHRKSLAGHAAAPAVQTGAVAQPIAADPDVSRLRELRRKAVTGRTTSANPLRVIVGLGSASEMEVARLALEFSNLCRAFGGQGMRFEINDCRVDASDYGLVELHAFSVVPLGGEQNGSALANWETFKSAVVLMSVLEPSLEMTFKATEPVDRSHPLRKLVSIAVRRADDVEQRGMLASDKSAANQLKRLESLIESLASEFNASVAASLI